ncbi:MAG: hypothetical protein ABW208_15160 [Pyrinomonadaceae bacterium]
MSDAHRALALLAALVFPCAQGCRVGASAPRAALLTQEAPGPSATPAPAPPAPPFPALKRGTEAFEPFLNLSDGEPKVLITFDSLKDIINPRGALAGRAAHE